MKSECSFTQPMLVMASETGTPSSTPLQIWLVLNWNPCLLPCDTENTNESVYHALYTFCLPFCFPCRIRFQCHFLLRIYVVYFLPATVVKDLDITFERRAVIFICLHWWIYLLTMLFDHAVTMMSLYWLIDSASLFVIPDTLLLLLLLVCFHGILTYMYHVSACLK